MKHHRLLIPFAALSLVVAACGGGTATQTPGGATTNPGGGTPTDIPQGTDGPIATQSGGGGGGGGTGGGTGQIHIEIGGPVEATVDEPFFAIGSRFGGPAGIQLNFTKDGSAGLAGITGVADTWTITWLSEEFTANAVECTLTNWNIGETSGSGSFDCKNGFATTPSNAYMTGVTMKGSFEAAN